MLANQGHPYIHSTVQEVKGLKKLYYLGGRPVSMQNFRLIVHIVYLFLHGCGLHYNVLSGLSVKQEIKGLTTNYITMHYPGRKPVYLSSLVLRLVSFASS